MIRTDRRKNGLGAGATTEPILGQFHDYSFIERETVNTRRINEFGSWHYSRETGYMNP